MSCCLFVRGAYMIDCHFGTKSMIFTDKKWIAAKY